MFSLFNRAEAMRKHEMMVFDWDKAARLIRKHNPEFASAGLQGEWEFSGGLIYAHGRPTNTSFTHLASTVSVPVLDMDGRVVKCYKMKHEVPEWGAETKWPKSALDILGVKM